MSTVPPPNDRITSDSYFGDAVTVAGLVYSPKDGRVGYMIRDPDGTRHAIGVDARDGSLVVLNRETSFMAEEVFRMTIGNQYLYEMTDADEAYVHAHVRDNARLGFAEGCRYPGRIHVIWHDQASGLFVIKGTGDSHCLQRWVAHMIGQRAVGLYDRVALRSRQYAKDARDDAYKMLPLETLHKLQAKAVDPTRLRVLPPLGASRRGRRKGRRVTVEAPSYKPTRSKHTRSKQTRSKQTRSKQTRSKQTRSK